jgi:hypothetical protein
MKMCNHPESNEILCSYSDALLSLISFVFVLQFSVCLLVLLRLSFAVQPMPESVKWFCPVKTGVLPVPLYAEHAWREGCIVVHIPVRVPT